MKHVGYMSKSGHLMTREKYEATLKSDTWRWVIEEHWTPVAPVYAGEFGEQPGGDTSVPPK